MIAIVAGLVFVAFGGFYFALAPRTGDVALPQASPTALAPAVAPAPAAQSGGPHHGDEAHIDAAAAPAAADGDAASIEAEIGLSEHAELQALLKKNFNPEYNELIMVAARRRNEGVSDRCSARSSMSASRRSCGAK